MWTGALPSFLPSFLEPAPKLETDHGGQQEPKWGEKQCVCVLLTPLATEISC